MKRLTLGVCLLAACLSTYAADEPTGTVHGRALMADSGGESSVVPGAKVKLSAETVSFEAEADAEGRYQFASIPPGIYQVEITAPGLAGSGLVSVVAGESADPRVTLDLETVKLAVTVSAEAAA